VGPGIGTASETAALLEQLIMSVKKPLVLDADALNILALHPEWIEKLPQQTLLTPHPKEFDRMFGACTSAYERLHKASNAAVKYKICILLKGAYSATCSAEGYIYFNSTGNPGMATSGSGDVLTGIATSLLAQGFSTETAAVTAAYLHGSAGDLACNEFSAECMIASDIIRKLGKAFKLQKDDELI
jgi:NAD(P)H-hydrate epimerase